jgi:hypothetical protein
MATPVDLARRLLGAAKDDELAARSILPIEEIADTIVGFHTQQAVIGADGSLTGYGGGLQRKRLLLELERGQGRL